MVFVVLFLRGDGGVEGSHQTYEKHGSGRKQIYVQTIKK